MRTFLMLSLLAAFPLVTHGGTGEDSWMKHCRKCHGADGTGNTAMGKIFKLKDFTDPAFQQELTDEHIRTSIRDGRTNESGSQVMLSFKDKMSEQEIEDLIAYFRSFAKE